MPISPYSSSRHGHNPEIVVLHTMLGSLSGTISWFQDPRNEGQTSAHYLIGKRGELVQMVSEEKAAHHAGIINKPSQEAKRVLKKYFWGQYINPNWYSIGIEVESRMVNGVVEDLTIQQVDAIVMLLKNLHDHLGIAIDDVHVITHQDIASYKPNLKKWKEAILKRLDESDPMKSTEMYLRGTSPTVYAVIGNVAVPFVTDWDSHQREFGKAQIIKLSEEDFDSRFKTSELFKITNAR